MWLNMTTRVRGVIASAKSLTIASGPPASAGSERQLLHHDAVPLRAQPPGADAAGVLLVGAHHLVARGQVEAVREEAHAHRRVLRERDLVGAGADQRGRPPSALQRAAGSRSAARRPAW